MTVATAPKIRDIPDVPRVLASKEFLGIKYEELAKGAVRLFGEAERDAERVEFENQRMLELSKQIRFLDPLGVSSAWDSLGRSLKAVGTTLGTIRERLLYKYGMSYELDELLAKAARQATLVGQEFVDDAKLMDQYRRDGTNFELIDGRPVHVHRPFYSGNLADKV